jgi:hypothetical protein
VGKQHVQDPQQRAAAAAEVHLFVSVFATVVCLLQGLLVAIYGFFCAQVRIAVVGSGTGEVLEAAGLPPTFTATKVRPVVVCAMQT